jgi:hypothetical protein
MRLNVKAMAVAIGILWGAVVLLTALVNMSRPEYGRAFLQILVSIYPGYRAAGAVGDLAVGVLYALLDGAVFGVALAWLYNRLLGESAAVGGEVKREAGVRYPPVEPGA